MIFKVIEYDLRLRTVVKKLSDVKQDDTPDINNPKIMYVVEDGDKLMKDVLNGGYNVHPVPPPNSAIKERSMTINEKTSRKIEKLLALG